MHAPSISIFILSELYANSRLGDCDFYINILDSIPADPACFVFSYHGFCGIFSAQGDR